MSSGKSSSATCFERAAVASSSSGDAQAFSRRITYMFISFSSRRTDLQSYAKVRTEDVSRCTGSYFAGTSVGIFTWREISLVKVRSGSVPLRRAAIFASLPTR